MDLSSLPLNVERGSPDLIKLALVLVGLDKAPANMFHPKLSNAQVIKAVGKHHDRHVVQYSIWAVTENDKLAVNDLGVDIRDVELYPPNVRAWLFQVMAAKGKDYLQCLEFVELGSVNDLAEIRFGLATGLKRRYFDGLETMVLEWAASEADADTAGQLYDHIVRYSVRCSAYEAYALDVYRQEHYQSPVRSRMEVAAQGLPIFRKLRLLGLEAQADLLSGVTFVAGNQINFGNVQAGAVSATGDAHNIGTVNSHYNQQTINAMQAQLSKFERELRSSSLEPALVDEGVAAATAAREDPSPSKLSGVLTTLGKIVSAGGATAHTIDALREITTEVGRLSGLC